MKPKPRVYRTNFVVRWTLENPCAMCGEPSGTKSRGSKQSPQHYGLIESLRWDSPRRLTPFIKRGNPTPMRTREQSGIRPVSFTENPLSTRPQLHLVIPWNCLRPNNAAKWVVFCCCPVELAAFWYCHTRRTVREIVDGWVVAELSSLWEWLRRIQIGVLGRNKP